MSEASAAAITEPTERVVELLGGARVFQMRMTTPLEAHDMLLRGLPSAALTYLVSKLTVLRQPGSLEMAIGMSLRTLQRRRDEAAKPLTQEQSGRTWKFAEILARAIKVFGSQQEAERWMDQPAMALNQHRPIDLLGTPVGVEAVEDVLRRMEYGVYT